MKPASTSTEEILKASRELVREKNWEALNIRSVAAACKVSVGCLYNYFTSKNELVAGTVESIWREIFQLPEEIKNKNDLKAALVQLYQQLKIGSEKYPDFASMHSVVLFPENKKQESETMLSTWNFIEKRIAETIKSDPSVNQERLKDLFSAEQAARILFAQILYSLVKNEFDPSPILEIADRLLYE